MATKPAVPAEIEMEDPFDSPGTGEFVDWASLNGELLVFVPKRYEDHVQTVHTKPGEKSPCVVADVYVLTGEEAEEAGELGKAYEDQMIFQAFQHRLKGKLPENGRFRFVLARLGQGPKRKGFNAPWVLVDVAEVAEDKAIARAWFAAFKAEQEARKAKEDPFD